ncbi:MAG: histidine phosphatase family protein [Candidatus Nanoarchaeia archaeon]|nr:histidine phosphatase family protein [Candidatus Nanoarchaeia archaeon]
MKIFFVRHGKTNYNEKHLCNDDPTKKVYLTELGLNQAKEVAEKLKGKKIEKIFISELPRTKQTAEIINKFHGVSIEVDPRINDRKTGFEGKPEEEFHRFIEKDLFGMHAPGGESFQDEKQRIFSFLESLKKMPLENLLVVSHHETMKIIIGFFENLTDEEMWHRRVSNCEVLEYLL